MIAFKSMDWFGGPRVGRRAEIRMYINEYVINVINIEGIEQLLLLIDDR